MAPTLVDTKLRLDWARAMWANLLREGPAHKTPRLVQHLRMLERRMAELEQQLGTEVGSPTASSHPNRGELVTEWGAPEVLVDAPVASRPIIAAYAQSAELRAERS